MSDYNIYEDSNINMVGTFDKPSDMFLLKGLELASQETMAMAFHLIDAKNYKDLETAQMADVIMLATLLEFFKDNGIRDIHRVIDMPISYYERWNQELRRAEDEGLLKEPDDGISKQEFDGMMDG